MADVSTLRALDAVKALAFIGDLSMGQPTDHSLRTSWLAPGLGQMSGHRPAHDAKSDKRQVHLGHYCGL